ncbi:MAG: hypothetical protein A2Y62_13070 [Candidatus Fischerbacteria bacterium RBG_13_37_8]|uniref:PBP domain-containing protein n=1 Tax=Candidatus Fischerbacteria bacterium RBG_13_37_8 TaxID=1817863 RepID=A0A1F5V5M2_9BACT|nr:MAG: hypothetical protein A2Y62_13070 [Candidatus Fischerbacteria bacterium RBG_13_37_8]
MKQLIARLFGTVLIIALFGVHYLLAGSEEMKGTITLSGAWAIYPTAVAWGEGFQKKYPDVKVDISAGGAGKGAADAIAGLVDIGMVSREPDPAEINKGIVPIYILHDAVFPIINAKNPARVELLRKGLKKEAFTGLYITGNYSSWDQIAGGAKKKSVHVYTRSDSCGASAAWAKYVDNKKQEDLKGVGVYGDPGLIAAVKRDPLGIGYTNFSYIFTREGTVLEGLIIVPIDVNENNIADANEVNDNREKAINAINKGTYPATRKNYFFVKGKPSQLVKLFIEYAFSEEGTRIVEEVGTSLPLTKPEREKMLQSLR